MSSLYGDLKYALRQVSKNPASTIIIRESRPRRYISDKEALGQWIKLGPDKWRRWMAMKLDSLAVSHYEWKKQHPLIVVGIV